MNRTLRGVLLGVLAFVYFVVYPHDLVSLLSPLQQILGVSTALSPWFYGALAVAMVCWTAVQIWGRKRVTSDEC